MTVDEALFADWLRAPAVPPPDEATLDAFDRLLDRLVHRAADGAAPGEVPEIDYRLAAPKWQFLRHAADRAGLVLHGSDRADLRELTPRQPGDTTEFGGQRAVFGATDGVWPMFYAVTDRTSHPMLVSTQCVHVGDPTGERHGPFWYFSITADILALSPWRAGTVYLLPPDGFVPEPSVVVRGHTVLPRQVACPAAVRPLARLAVAPEDFPFLDRIRGHDDAAIFARVEADTVGFPWLDA
ncbi:hypothetical protein [Streptomyces radicis]|uniref:Uncharacterized protein n=1 Tax=Streptomyces radicis TaxID=1750517 RepID=A0A3A9VR02_9ACTN|nr:hypothetical protein [Streptomyces radicis]RKN03189.1 hypothetical protein D7319_32080 [Streptomyces radicis]RKN13086.1 hypothetical protein D7318_31945 [Streptomyces radicis]